MSSSPPNSLIPSFDALFDNPLFAGGIGLAGVGAVAAFARRSSIKGAAALKKRLLVNIEISKQDPSYKMMLAWLALPRPPVGRITASLTRIHDLEMKTSTETSPDGALVTRFQLQPGFGRQIIRHKNAFIVTKREKLGNNTSGGEPHETLTLTTLYAHRHIFEDIFTEARVLSTSQHEGKTRLFTPRGMDWEPLGSPQPKRKFDSVILDVGIKERILADVEEFLSRHQWYVDRGIPYRRGYLLYGPPGSGKTSFIRALAGELGYSVALISLVQRGMTDDKLIQLFLKVPPQSILLLEDADAVFLNRRKVDGEGYNGANVTFSGLLNALDGMTTTNEERITFLTTNHIEHLDNALIRPGRVDLRVKVGDASRYQAAGMWDQFYGDIDIDGSGKGRFLENVTALGLIGEGKTPARHPISTAAIQGLFLCHKDDFEGAIRAVETLIPQ